MKVLECWPEKYPLTYEPVVRPVLEFVCGVAEMMVTDRKVVVDNSLWLIAVIDLALDMNREPHAGT